MTQDKDQQKIIVYQVFTRLFGNTVTRRKPHGDKSENGVGKMNDFDEKVLTQIRSLGATHIWYTGVIRHATQTNYEAYNIPTQHTAVVKGKAGSPYAIVDYYDIDPDLAQDVDNRMAEFEQLVERSHRMGLKVIIDFVPNHVARQYHSVAKPAGVTDLGVEDDVNMNFSPSNNFYYCEGKPFAPAFSLTDAAGNTYHEQPARATGNDCFNASPSVNDWYETVKLNYGVDYCCGYGVQHHFDPIPSTWKKMCHILAFWASKGIDGFRCDMAEMVPTAFWQYAISGVKQAFPNLLFIGEVYNPALYRSYVAAGFDFLYDKVGLYDCLIDVMRGYRSAEEITRQWQAVDDIHDKMLYFLENHDEQRLASNYILGTNHAAKALPAMMVSAWMRTNPVMVYAGQEVGEPGMDAEGFSGCDGRTTIFDYWCVERLRKTYFAREEMTTEMEQLEARYQKILQLANAEKAICKGRFFDVMYANSESPLFDTHRCYAFLRHFEEDLLLVVVNFSDNDKQVSVRIPAHAFDVLSIEEGVYPCMECMTQAQKVVTLKRDETVTVSVPANDGCIYKIKMISNSR